MNVYEVTLHSTDSIYLLAPTKYYAGTGGRLPGRRRPARHAAVRQIRSTSARPVRRAETPSRKMPGLSSE